MEQKHFFSLRAFNFWWYVNQLNALKTIYLEIMITAQLVFNGTLWSITLLKRAHKLDRTLNLSNSANILATYVFNVPFYSLTKILITLVILPMCATWLSQFIFLIGLNEYHMVKIINCKALRYTFLSNTFLFPLESNFLLGAPFHTFPFCPTDQGSQPHRATRNI